MIARLALALVALAAIAVPAAAPPAPPRWRTAAQLDADLAALKLEFKEAVARERIERMQREAK